MKGLKLVFVGLLVLVLLVLVVRGLAVRGHQMHAQPVRVHTAPPAPAAPPVTSRPAPFPIPPYPSLPAEAKLDVVTRVVDGDTLYTKHHGEIRLIGIDAPEHGWYGDEAATKFLGKLLLHKQVYVWVDSANPKDPYNRTRALLFVEKGGKWYNVNRLLVAEGYAVVSIYKTSPVDPNLWLADQQQAQQAKRGAWQQYKDAQEFTKGKRALHKQQAERQSAQNKATLDAAPPGTKYIGNTHSMKFHRLDCKYLPDVHNARYFKSREEAIEAGFKPCGFCKP